MTKQEAIEAMEQGRIVSHDYFTSDEWMMISGDVYAFEDGCKCPPDRFWESRYQDGWNDGWMIVK